MRRIVIVLLCGALMWSTSESLADSGDPGPREKDLLGSSAFLDAHPDLLYRGRGWAAFKRGEHRKAMRWFVRGARYADKPSQVMIAELLWNGQGVASDRALAYVWMDLAAERGYEGFVALRELYWQQLDDDERRSALERGPALYAEFGDPAARPRIARALRRGLGQMTGSRTGFRGGALWITIPAPDGGELLVHGSEFYAEKFWDPDAYQAWHDSVWKTPKTGNVQVGDVEQLERAKGE